MNPADLKRGATVRVRGFSGVACWYKGPETRPGNTIVTCWECSGKGCEYCDDTGEIHDEEPEPIDAGFGFVAFDPRLDLRARML